MRRYFLCFFTAASLICTNAFALDKLYLNARDIMICDNGIFIKIEGCLFKTRSIHHDDIGNYIIDLEAKRCSDCEREYPAYEKECPYKELHDNNENDNNNNNDE